MGFYEEIATYYDEIFVVGEDEIKFISEKAGGIPKDILDVACGTGGYSLKLATLGYNLTAVDLDKKMIDELESKANNNNISIKAFQGNMLNIKSKLSSKFDLAFCVGNSLVHLDGEGEIEEFLKEIKAVLKHKGTLLIQIINYDRILGNSIHSLPTIESKDKSLRFQRMYNYEETSNINKIIFKTILKVGEKGIENSIPLYPIESYKLLELLNKTGFEELELYGDFENSPYNKEESYMLVILAKS